MPTGWTWPSGMAGALAGFDLLRCVSVSYEAESGKGRRQVVDAVAIAPASGLSDTAARECVSGTFAR